MTIVEVAKLAGLSVCSVSRYFNSPELVSAAATEKIRAVLQEHPFELKPNRRGPKSGLRAGIKTHRIVLLNLFTQQTMQLDRQPVSAEIFTAARDVFQSRGLYLTVAQIQPDGSLPPESCRAHCDGVILYGTRPGAEAWHLREALAGLPAIHCFANERTDSPYGVDYVGYDNVRVGELAAEHLFRKGHRHAVVFNPQRAGHPVFHMRTEAFCRRAAKLGLKVEVLMPSGTTHSIQEMCRMLAEQYRASACRNWQGCFFCNDQILHGVAFELAQMGISLARLDVIGCDNQHAFLDFHAPRPATIDIRLGEIGAHTAERLLYRINHSTRKNVVVPPENRLLPPRIVPGE